MSPQSVKAELNQRTCDLIRKQTGVELTEAEAEEIRQSLVQYCRLLIEISQDQPEEEHARSTLSQ
ncbi:MAG: hypothetical protein DRP45_03855 [Candidatus Zixiibacteriota bacterium]|nr:MAG: hypothetical protein DRP45_03855 [candidate division Zixibacteria bacterium]